MWEKIGASSGIVIGAVVLFLLFTLVLLIMEKDEFKKRRRRKTVYALPKTEYIKNTQRRYQHKLNTTSNHNNNLRKIG